MCIGLPMCVETSDLGHAIVRGRAEVRHVDLALVGPCEPGQWLLVFLDAAREKLTVGRSQEIDAALDLLEAALAGDAVRARTADVGFALPSAMGEAELRKLTGQDA
jgi:hydrogenase expression/formation protein HypC